MDPRAIQKASSRLRVAQKTIGDLEACKTFGSFSDHWHVFLTAAKNVYTVLEQGSKSSPQSMQWFGAKQTIMRKDSLLQYIYEARNDDEHGLGSSVDLKPERHEIGVAGDGASQMVRLDGGPFRNVVIANSQTAVVFEGMSPPPGLRVTSLDGKPVLRRHSAATAILIDVEARGNRIIAPPTSHLGEPLSDGSPVAVAKLAVAYLDALATEASALPAAKT